MLAIRLDPKLEARVDGLAKATGKTKSEIVREAVVRLALVLQREQHLIGEIARPLLEVAIGAGESKVHRRRGV